MSYNKYKRYARTFTEHYWGDLIHNIWLRYFNNTGKDLFQENKPDRYIWRSVRNEFINSLYMRNRFEGLEVHVSNFDEDGIWDGPDGDEMTRVELIEEPSVINNIIYNELDCFIKAKIQQYALVKSENSNASNYEKTLQLTLEVYDRIKMSYRNVDISEELGMSDQSVRHYRKEIIKSIKYMALHNPFVGNKIQVKKSISQDTWDAKLKENKKELEEWELDDENEYYKLYVNESNDGLLVKLKQQKINPYLQNPR